jgi:hypothetical protein
MNRSFPIHQLEDELKTFQQHLETDEKTNSSVATALAYILENKSLFLNFQLKLRKCLPTEAEIISISFPSIQIPRLPEVFSFLISSEIVSSLIFSIIQHKQKNLEKASSAHSHFQELLKCRNQSQELELLDFYSRFPIPEFSASKYHLHIHLPFVPTVLPKYSNFLIPPKIDEDRQFFEHYFSPNPLLISTITGFRSSSPKESLIKMRKNLIATKKEMLTEYLEMLKFQLLDEDFISFPRIDLLLNCPIYANYRKAYLLQAQEIQEELSSVANSFNEICDSLKKISSDFCSVDIRLQDTVKNHREAIENDSSLNLQQREMLVIHRTIKKMNLSPFFISRSSVYKFLCIGFAGKFDDLSQEIRESIRLMKSNDQFSIPPKQAISEDDKQRLADSEKLAKSKTEFLHQAIASYKEAVEALQRYFYITI